MNKENMRPLPVITDNRKEYVPMYMRRCNINPTKDITLQRDQSLYKSGF